MSKKKSGRSKGNPAKAVVHGVDLDPLSTAIRFTCGQCNEETFGVLALYRDGKVSVPAAFGEEWQETPPKFGWAMEDNTVLLAWQCENCTANPSEMHYTVLGDTALKFLGEGTDPDSGKTTKFYGLPRLAEVRPE